MKAGGGFIIAGIIIIAIGVVWLFLGMPSTDIEQRISSTVSLPQVLATSPTPTTGPGIVTTTNIPVVTETTAPSADAAKLHFLDIAFGEDNNVLERWPPVPDNGRLVVSLVGNRDTDTATIQAAIQEFNSLSRTTQISTQVKQGSATGDLVIKFIPEEGMDAITLNTSERLPNKVFFRNVTPAAKITLGTIYINADLKGDERRHILLKSFFYELGLPGDTDIYPDSLFYSGINTNTALSPIDKEAVRILYGTGLTPGMRANDVKNLLFVR